MIDALGAPHVGERSEKLLIASFVDRIAELTPQLVTLRSNRRDELPATLKIARGRFEPQRQQRPYRDHRATIAIANVKRTFWSPNWSRTRDHGPVLNGTERHVRPIFATQINTCHDRTKRVETATNKFRVRCFQPLSHLSAAEGARPARWAAM